MVTPELDIWSQFGQLSVHIGEDEIRVYGPQTDPATAVEVAPTPTALRKWLRFDDRGRYRPLASARSMRSGWVARFPTLDAFSRALAEIYPLAEEQIAAAAAGRLSIVSLAEVLERQSGRYENTAKLSDAGRAAASDALCRGCVRTPLWRDGAPVPLVAPENPIPCPEPCSVLVALCREAALWEAEPPEPAPIDPSLPFAAFEEPGNEIREAYLHARRERPQ